MPFEILPLMLGFYFCKKDNKAEKSASTACSNQWSQSGDSFCWHSFHTKVSVCDCLLRGKVPSQYSAFVVCPRGGSENWGRALWIRMIFQPKDKNINMPFNDFCFGLLEGKRWAASIPWATQFGHPCWESWNRASVWRTRRRVASPWSSRPPSVCRSPPTTPTAPLAPWSSRSAD